MCSSVQSFPVSAAPEYSIQFSYFTLAHKYLFLLLKAFDLCLSEFGNVFKEFCFTGWVSISSPFGYLMKLEFV